MVFTGAEGINPGRRIAYDPCYHLACDTFDNVSLTALDETSDAAARRADVRHDHVVGTRPDQGNGNGTQSEAEFSGSHAQHCGGGA